MTPDRDIQQLQKFIQKYSVVMLYEEKEMLKRIEERIAVIPAIPKKKITHLERVREMVYGT